MRRRRRSAVSPGPARIASTVGGRATSRPLAGDRGRVDDQVARPSVGQEGGRRRRIEVEQLHDVRDAVADEDAGRPHRDQAGAGRDPRLEAPDRREVGGLTVDEARGEPSRRRRPRRGPRRRPTAAEQARPECRPAARQPAVDGPGELPGPERDEDRDGRHRGEEEPRVLVRRPGEEGQHDGRPADQQDRGREAAASRDPGRAPDREKAGRPEPVGRDGLAEVERPARRRVGEPAVARRERGPQTRSSGSHVYAPKSAANGTVVPPTMARPIGTATGARTIAPTSAAAPASRIARAPVGSPDRSNAEKRDRGDRHGDEAIDPARVDGGRDRGGGQEKPARAFRPAVPAGGPRSRGRKRHRQRVRHRHGARLPELAGERGDDRRSDGHRDDRAAPADPSPDRLRGQEARHDRDERARQEAHHEPDPAVRPGHERDRRDDDREARRLLERRDRPTVQERVAQRPEGVVDVPERVLAVQPVEAMRRDEDESRPRTRAGPARSAPSADRRTVRRRLGHGRPSTGLSSTPSP